MTLTTEITCLLLTYLLGSIPFGYLLTKKTTGKNILEFGSGNPGSTNVGRIAGKRIALFTQLLDMLKGFLPIVLFMFFYGEKYTTTPVYFVYAMAMAAILGHNFSIFLKFKGGKGVNTTLGASVLLAPYPVFIAIAVYFLIKWSFKYVSLGSMCLAIALPLTEFILHGLTPVFYYLTLCFVLIILMHSKNIGRLMKGKEN